MNIAIITKYLKNALKVYPMNPQIIINKTQTPVFVG